MTRRKFPRENRVDRDREELLDELSREPSERGIGRRGSRSSKRRGGFGVVGAILVSCALLAVVVAADYMMNQGTVHRGVSVSGVDVGGLSPVEAQRVVEEQTAGGLDEVSFTGPGEGMTMTAEQLGIRFDVAATIEEAYSYGRSGGLGERASERFSAMAGNGRVEPDVSYDSAVAQQAVERLAGEFDRQAQDASVALDGGEATMQPAAQGYEVDRGATLENVQRTVDSLGGEVAVVGRELQPTVATAEAEAAEGMLSRALAEPLVLTAAEQEDEWTFQPEQVAQMLQVRTEGSQIDVSMNQQAFRTVAEDVYGALNVPAREAEYEVDGTSVDVLASRDGLRLQEEQLLPDISEKIFQGQSRYRLPVEVERPEMTTEQAEAMAPTTMVGEYDTNYLSYDDDPGRLENLNISSNAINDTLLAPGEVFSFNALAAPLQYEEASVIVDGQVQTADGGGLCQVSSGIYMAANYAGLEIVERHPHHAELPYIQPGFDATVWFGALDMQFRNNTDGYLLIKQSVNESSGDVVSQIYGQPTNTEVEMESEKVFDGTDSEDNPMTQWVTNKTIERDGQTVFSGVVNEDTYKYLEPADSNAPADA